MVYIIGNKGFFKEKRFSVEKRENEFIWTDTVQDAKQFKSIGMAEKFLKSYNLKGFVWTPTKEEPIRDKYRVVKYEPRFSWEMKNELKGWIVEKVIMESNSEIKFLNGTLPTNYFDLVTAEMICEQKNREAMENFFKKFPMLRENNSND